MLQEGKGFTGLAFKKGWHPIAIYKDILKAGGGY